MCRVAGRPPPTVSWSKDGKPIRHRRKYRIQSSNEDHTLEVTSVTVDDVGQYICTLSNSVGDAKCAANLIVGEVTPSQPAPTDFRAVLHLRSDISHLGTPNSTGSAKLELSLKQDITKKWIDGSSKKPQVPSVEKKGGIQQVDFRNVLKKHEDKQSDKRTEKLERKLNVPTPLSQREQNRETDRKPNTSAVHSRLNLSTVHSTPNASTVHKGLNASTVHKGLNASTVLSTSTTRTVHKGLNSSTVQSTPNTSTVPRGLNSSTVHSTPNVSTLLKGFNSSTAQSAPKVSTVLRGLNSSPVHSTPTTSTVQRGLNSSTVHSISLTSPVQKGTKSSTVHSIPNTSSVHRGLNSSKDSVLTKPEGIQSGKQVDFRSVLKKKKENGSHTAQTVQLDLEKDKISRLDSLISITKKLERSEIYTKPAVAKQPVEMKKTPEFRSRLEDQLVKYGSEVVLECSVEGTPEPEISWSINDKIIKKSKFFRMSYENHYARLVIAEAFSEDEGEYKCTASNSAGNASKSCRLHVEASHSSEDHSDEDTASEVYSPDISPPKIYDISPSQFSILRGGAMEFRTSYSAVPRAEVRWMKNSAELTTGGRVNVDTTEHFSTLTIQNVQPGDSGRYNVHVENNIGSDTATASLNVQDVPDPPVGIPTVSDVTQRSITLSWYGPAYDGGCPVTNYRVEMCDAEDQIWTLVTSSCKTTTYHIDQLTPNTPYFFRVFAENRHGPSRPCQTPDVTVTTDKRPPMLRTLSIESDDELPFEHREVKMTPGRVFEDHYTCFEEVGKGKFGSVYRCEEKVGGGNWAAKIIKSREADKPKIRLEVEIMNQLKHPKILMLWDVFEVPRKMILVMEYVGGGELFERVMDDDFELTERDCIQFMRQICDAVNYMHGKNILHLDLKPENILCIKNESNKIKIIDFGLARFYKPGESLKVLFGTPEFIAPEVVNYEEIGFQTDMWSLGVICYVLLSGLSPFMGDSDSETLSNVTQGEFDFDDESFEGISRNAKDFIDSLLIKNKRKRLTAQQCLDHKWLAQDPNRMKLRRINTQNLKRFMARRKWQKTGKAILALGRITGLQKAFKRRTPDGDGQGSGGSGSSSSSVDSQCLSPSSEVSDRSSATLVSDSVSKVTLLEEGAQRYRNGGISEEFRKSKNEAVVELDKSKRDINSNDRTASLNINLSSDIKTSRIQTENSANQEEGKFKWTNQNSSNGLKSDAISMFNSGNPAIPRVSVEDTREDRHTEKKDEEHLPGSPYFTKEMIDSKAFPGDAVRFDVVVIGEPVPEIQWYFEEDLLTESPRHIIQHGDGGDCSLIIKDVTEDDDGEYSCKAVNKTGEAICYAELIVYGAI